jgi:hypothetical protein
VNEDAPSGKRRRKSGEVDVDIVWLAQHQSPDFEKSRTRAVDDLGSSRKAASTVRVGDQDIRVTDLKNALLAKSTREILDFVPFEEVKIIEAIAKRVKSLVHALQPYSKTDMGRQALNCVMAAVASDYKPSNRKDILTRDDPNQADIAKFFEISPGVVARASERRGAYMEYGQHMSPSDALEEDIWLYPSRKVNQYLLTSCVLTMA